MVMVFAILFLIAGIYVGRFIQDKAYMLAFCLAFGVIGVSVFLQFTADFVLNHAACGYRCGGYCSRY
jgi:uncharacterized membrane protein YoaK (UPF0700 family)